MNKYHARKTHSTLCDRTFDSKAEAVRGEELHLLQRAGEIACLQYQVLFKLCDKPKITIKLDFAYVEDGVFGEYKIPVKVQVYEDVKGVLTRDSRTKLAWLEQSQGIRVRLIR